MFWFTIYGKSLPFWNIFEMENVTDNNHTMDSTIQDVTNTTVDLNTYEDLNEKANNIWKIISPVLFIIGMTGNTLIIIALKKMNFQQKPPYIFLFTLALLDMTVLSVGLSQYWVKNTFDYNLRLTGPAGCKISLFVIYWSMQCSSWVLVCVVFERFLKTKFPLKYMRFISIRKCVCLIILVVVILGGVDMHLLITNGITYTGNETDCTSLNTRYFNYDEYVFVWIDLTFVSILPFLLMISMNAVMIHVLRRSRQFRRNTVQNSTTNYRMNRFDRRLTTMLLVTSVYFLITTAPISIYYIVDSYDKRPKSKYTEAVLHLIRTIFYLLQFSNYAMNFIIYNLSNQQFRRKFWGVLKFNSRNSR